MACLHIVSRVRTTPGACRVVVYTTDWAQWRGSDDPKHNITRPGYCKAYATTPGNVNPQHVTHINYGAARAKGCRGKVGAFA